LQDVAAVLEHIVDAEDIDSIDTHNLLAGHAPGVPAVVAECGKKRGLPHLTTVHDMPNGEVISAAHRTETEAILRSATVIVTSDANYRAFAELFWLPAAIIPPATDFSAFSSVGPPDPRTIAYPGRLVPYNIRVR